MSKNKQKKQAKRQAKGKLPQTRSGQRYGGNPVKLDFPVEYSKPVELVPDLPSPVLHLDKGIMSDIPMAPPLPSDEYRMMHSNAFDAGVRQGKFLRMKRRGRKRKSKKRTTRRRTARGGLQVYQPTGQIAGVLGRGSYFTDALSAMGKAAKRMVPDGAFGRLGRAGGGAMGGKLGATLGGLFGQGISAITGFGAYNVSQNSLMAHVDEGVQIPQFADGNHATIVTHREYLQDIVVPATASAFTNIVIPINPGLNTTFPWLSGIASNYSQYQILGMIIEFRTLSSDITSGGALGSIIMASDYDVVDTAYANKIEMENSEYCTSNKPSVDTVHCIECDPAVTFAPMKYIRSSPVPSGKDPRLYDHANFQIATTGLPGTTGQVLGELWISYQIAFYKPNLQNSLSFFDGGSDHFTLAYATVTNTAMFGVTTATAANSGSTLGCTVNNNVLTLPAGLPVGSVYLINAVYFGASSNITGAVSSITYSGCASDNLLLNNGSSQFAVVAGTGTLYSRSQWITAIVKITSATGNPTVTWGLSSGIFPGSLTAADLYVTALPASIT